MRWRATPRRRRALILLSCLLPGLAACAGSIKVRTWRDRAVDFGEYRTFAWVPGTGSSRLAGELGATDDAHLRRMVEQQLVRKGFAPADREEADFRLAYQYYPPPQQRFAPPASPGPGSAGWQASASWERSYTNQLLLEVRDGETHQTVWRGRALRVMVPRGDPRARLAEAVRKILEGFPPP